MLADYQREFLDFAIDHDILQFGRFELKSGRISPYFFNAGLFNTGATLGRVGEYYAEALARSGLTYDMLFGPAYKGIPLVTATAIALARNRNVDVPYAFNRKEEKDHGEGGNLVGAPLKGNVVIVDDIITAGTAIRESMAVVQNNGARPVGVLVGIDRQERGTGQLSAIQEIERDYGVVVIRVIGFDDIVEYIRGQEHLQEQLRSMEIYRNEYGIAG
ncbi:MAG: orotate phosphoribosyltransferase [Pseudomonadales bacterium]